MKKALSLLMSVMLLVTCFGTAAAAADLNLTYHITNELDYYGEYKITVPSGTIITVNFEIENNDGDEFTLSSLQNEIYFDDSFFEYEQGEEVAFEGIGCGLKEYSDGEQRVFVNTVTDTTFNARHKVASFKLKVTETQVGASSVIETKSQLANGTDPGIAEKNLTVVIGETPADARKYDITYRDNDGSVLHVDEDILNGQTAHLNSTITKAGYILDGWLINNVSYNPGDAIKVTGNIDAYAKWISETPVTYSVSFNTNGGSFVQAVSGVKGSTVQLTQKPTKSGYTFDGWYADAGFTGSPITSVTLNSDTTVYAKWSQNSGGGGGGGGGGGTGNVQKHTITFMTPDGIVLDEVDRAKGSEVDLSMFRYTKEGYRFDGWYTEKELTNKVTRITLSTDITLYAKWSERASSHPAILTTEHYAYIMGRDGGMICPDDNITRAEVATIFFRLLTEDVRKESLSKENAFADVSEADWFNTAVSTLAGLKIINGRTADSFEPNANITRAEFTAIAARFSDGTYAGEDYFTDIARHWAKDYINIAADLGWIVGENGIFRPDDNITRAEVMTLVNRVLGRLPETEADLLENMTKWVDNADTSAWYYLAVQEATNSHNYEYKDGGVYEKWTKLTESPDWTEFEK